MGCASSTPVNSEANGKSAEPTKKAADKEPAKPQDKLPTANSHSPESNEVRTEHAASNAQQDYLDKTCSEVVDEALKEAAEAAAAASRAENTSNSAGQGGESSENSQQRQQEPDAVQSEQKPTSRPQTANQQPAENAHSKDIETLRVATTDEQQAAPAAEARTEENAA